MSISVQTKISYHRPIIDDHEKISRYLKHPDEMACEKTFGNIFLWAEYYGAEFAEVQQMLLIRLCTKNGCSYAYPMGDGDAKATMEMLISQVRACGTPFRMHGLSEQQVAKVEEMFPNRFAFVAARESFDYIYRTEDLIALKGKKYHGKRNHINRFMENNPDWQYEPITKHNTQECMALAREWCERNENVGEGVNAGHLAELSVIETGLLHFTELGFVGGLIRTGGKVAAFTFGEPINDKVFVVHIEKAYAHIQGAYPMITNQFLLREVSSYEFVNREEDLGLEGLRKAKLSYRPSILLEKYSACLKTE